MRQPRPPIALLAAAVLLFSFSPSPAHAFQCNSITASEIQYDISTLAGHRTVTKQTETPPTRSEARVSLNICNGLAPEDGVANEDQCPVGTRVCLKMVNTKNENERVISVIPIWGKETPDEKVGTTPMGSGGQEGLKIWVEGPEYAGTTQTLNLTLLCSQEAHDQNPSFESYTPGRLSLVWSSPHACPRSKDGASTGGGGDGSSSGGGGGMGFWGFLRLLFWLFVGGLIAYFAIGILYNHQQYSARGWDLLPHRDFWREFPTLVSDLFSHVFANVRGGGGGSRGGYSSLG